MFLTILPDTKTHTIFNSLISYSYQIKATMFSFVKIKLRISSFVYPYSFLSPAASWINGLCSLGIFQTNAASGRHALITDDANTTVYSAALKQYAQCCSSRCG